MIALGQLLQSTWTMQPHGNNNNTSKSDNHNPLLLFLSTAQLADEFFHLVYKQNKTQRWIHTIANQVQLVILS